MTYICLLRGINVSGQKLVKMELLRKSFGAMGFKDVKTYIQSGNVIFSGPKTSNANLEKKIHARILKDFKFEVPVVVKTAGELEKIIKSNPFIGKKGIDESKLHVTFLSGVPLKTSIVNLDAYITKPEQCICLKSEVYLYCPMNYGTSKLSPANIERALAHSSTTRNWRTVQALMKLLTLN